MVPIGGRVRFWVDITNRGSMTVLLSNSSCGAVLDRGAGTNGPSAGTSPTVRVPTWSRWHPSPPRTTCACVRSPPAATGDRRRRCADGPRRAPVRLGDSITLQYVVDVPVVPGAPAQSTRFDIEATVAWVRRRRGHGADRVSTVGRACGPVGHGSPRLSTSPAMFLAGWSRSVVRRVAGRLRDVEQLPDHAQLRQRWLRAVARRRCTASGYGATARPARSSTSGRWRAAGSGGRSRR